MRGLVVFLLAMSLVGCASIGSVRTKNRERLTKLSVGMSKSEVLKTMGTGTTYDVFSRPSRINNPYRTETLKGKDGKFYEVLHYYTDIKKSDFAITDDELTPIVLADDRVVGWGWGFLNDNVSKYHMQIDVR